MTELVEYRQSPIAAGDPPEDTLPARHPRLRDAAVILAMVSTVCYFAISEGVRGFVSFLLRIGARLIHASR